MVGNRSAPRAVVRPGNDPVPAGAKQAHRTLNLLAVGSVVRRKGYDVLIGP
jgi:hypothetical protein